MERGDENPLAFLGLGVVSDTPSEADISILSVPLEMTTSWGDGTRDGPQSILTASLQVELYDEYLGENVPAGSQIVTAKPWDSDAPTLVGQLKSITDYLRPWFNGSCFPLVLGGEHGILPPLLQAVAQHPMVNGDFSRLTVVQIDAHADLRDELGGEEWSHACSAKRALETKIGALIQVGIRSYCKEEVDLLKSNDRITAYTAKKLLSPSFRNSAWSEMIEHFSSIRGPVHLTIDVDGLDGSLVPSTGTPVPGGLSFWHLVEVVEALFGNTDANVISADICETVPGTESPLPEFTSALIARHIVAAHIKSQTALRKS